MKSGEQKLMMRGVAAGTMIGLALGGIIALFIALRPDLLARLME